MQLLRPKRFHLLLIISFLLGTSSCDQQLSEGQKFNLSFPTIQLGTEFDDYAQDFALDSKGNSYVTGHTNGDLDISGEGIHAGAQDYFIIKFDSSGNLKWIRQNGTTLGDHAYGIALDNADNIYVVGTTEGSLPGNTNLGAKDLFLAKFGPDGNERWIKQIGSSSYDCAKSIAVDKDNNGIYVTGYTWGALDEESVYTGSYDIFLAKFNSHGEIQWTTQMGTTGIDEAEDIATDSSGNVYVTGYTDGDLDGPNENTHAGSFDIFLAKYDPNGNNLWIRQIGTVANDRASGVTTDSSGNIYLTGHTGGDLDGKGSPDGSLDLFVTKYDPNGINLWIKQMRATTQEAGYDITVDNKDNIYVTGITDGSLDGNSNNGEFDFFLAKYDADGIKQWTKQKGSQNHDYARGISVNTSGYTFITGWTFGDFGTSTNAGGSDLFLIKLDNSD